MGQIYEGMFLLDNDVVRAGYTKAKSVVTDMLAKHGATLHCVRRWDERRMTYPINHRQRATYFLAYYEIPTGEIDAMRRDLDLTETVLRYLMLAVEAIPEGEVEKANLEEGADFVVPEPPDDDEIDEEPESEEGEGEGEEKSEGEAKDGDAPAEGDKADGEKADGEKAEGDAETKKDEAADAPAPEAAAAATTTEGGDAPKEA